MKKIFIGLLFTGLSAIGSTKYSATVFSRPFTLPQNSFDTTVNFSNERFASLSANYGITEQLQLGLEWQGLDVGYMADQKIALNAAHFLYTTRWVSAMTKFNLPFHFNRLVLQDFTSSAPTYAHIWRGKINLVFLEDLVKISWLEETHAIFNLSTRLSWQATHALCLNLKTNWVALNTLGNHVHIGQTTPVEFSTLYAVTPMVDVIGSVRFLNVQNVTGFSAMLGVSLRGGDIEG